MNGVRVSSGPDRGVTKSVRKMFRIEPLGRMAVFLLPSLKLKQKRLGKSFEEIVHHFLMKHFAGYTASAGNIFGFWRDDTTHREYYGEHKEYKVSFRGKNRVEMLQKFLSQLAGELNEDCIYLEYGENAWLVYARGRRTARRRGSGGKSASAG